MSKKTPCENCKDGKCTCTTIKVQSLKTNEDHEKYEKKVFPNLFEDYIKDLTDKDQPACSLEDQEGCENCSS